MKQDKKKRVTRIAALCLLGVFLGTVSAWNQVTSDNGSASVMASMEPAAGSALAGADIGGPFTLTDHNGNAVTELDFAGQYKLIYFGFTFCPEICPTALQEIDVTMKILGVMGKNVTPVFVTTDPERDTPEVMRDYVELFNPRMVGLTGTPEQIMAMQETYRVYAAKTDNPDFSEYMMNHSSYIYLMGPNDEPLTLFSDEDTPQTMAVEIKRVLQQS